VTTNDVAAHPTDGDALREQVAEALRRRGRELSEWAGDSEEEHYLALAEAVMPLLERQADDLARLNRAMADTLLRADSLLKETLQLTRERDEERADRDAARRERDEMRQQRDMVKVELGSEQLKTQGALEAAERWARAATPPFPPDAVAVLTRTALELTGQPGLENVPDRMHDAFRDLFAGWREHALRTGTVPPETPTEGPYVQWKPAKDGGAE
jgi:hypothetical protein